MSVRFGTDGIRGRAITDLTPETALVLGRACGRALGASRVIIGRDTRLSGPIFESAFAAGCAAEGVDVDLLGIVPTPAVAWLAQVEHVAAAVVTASHNPWTDNGIKVFAPGGRKLDDDQQRVIESLCASPLVVPPDSAESVGTIRHRTDVPDLYIEAIVAAIGAGSLQGLRIVVDAANGAMGPVARDVLKRLGAHVEVIFDSLAGDDVNDQCGATHPGALSARVHAVGADLGLAFDGDGDRVIAVDRHGDIVDGDRLIALLARDRLERGRLPGAQVAVTVMTNLGFHRAMKQSGIEVTTTPVGDRHVLEALEATGAVLGGEQSGHIIQRDLMPSGDGLLAGACIAELVCRLGRPLDELAREVMTSFPQVLVNVAVPPGRSHDVAEGLGARVAEVQARVGDDGRVLVRPSGTEPVVRIMVEAADASLARMLADELAEQATQLSGCTSG